VSYLERINGYGYHLEPQAGLGQVEPAAVAVVLRE
jgi:hypothetical protein